MTGLGFIVELTLQNAKELQNLQTSSDGIGCGDWEKNEKERKSKKDNCECGLHKSSTTATIKRLYDK